MRSQTVLGGLAVLAVGTATLAYARGHDGDGSPRAKAQPENVLVKFRPGIAASERATLHRKHGHQVTKGIPQLDIHVVRVPPGKSTDDVMARYRNHPLIEFVEPDRLHAPAYVPNDPYYGYQWHLSQIDAPLAWDTTPGSSDLIIAVLDTGVDDTLPELAPNMVPGWNCFDDNDDTSDILGHGTTVAGTAAAVGDNNTLVASVAWGCKLMPVRVSNSFGWASDSAIAYGLTWSADHGARVANVSFEMMNSSTLDSAAQYFRSAGGVVVLGSGNSGEVDTSGDNPYFLTVSATDKDDLVPSWSNTGSSIDLSAPGTSIITVGTSGGTASGGGTSYAAPIVAGVAALVISVNPGLSATDIEDILEQSADDFGPAGWDASYGWGRVNAGGAVDLALNHGGSDDTTPPTATIAVPTAGTVLSGTAAVLVEASDDVGVTQVDLFVDGVFLSGDTVPPHEWALDTTALADGAHAISALAYDAAGNTGSSAPVEVTVDNSAGQCVSDADCDDQVYCNGVETCVDGDCQPGTPVDCNDGINCTIDSCDEAVDACIHAPDDAVCDDGNFCNGDEACDSRLGCRAGGDPCPGQLCDEAAVSCVDCLGDGDCDDGLFCNGVEACVAGFCADGADPCPGQDCDDADGVCLPLVCDDDGVCDPGEDCNVCPGDCFSDSMAVCGNGLCETADGEDCLSCPQDCNGVQTGGPSGRYCCGGGNGVNPVGCDDPRCSSDGNVCTATPSVSTCCGDLICEGNEDSSNCAVDCPPSPCGNGVCDPGEDCHSCPDDCTQSKKAHRIGTYCCGNGIVEDRRETGVLCDGNP